MQSAEAIIHFELKYCERCGGLWLRPCDSAAIYCPPCARQMAEVARRCRRRGPGSAGQPAAVVACVAAAAQPAVEVAAECGA